MHKILEFILAAAIIMSVLVATDYIVRTYVSSTQEPSNYLKISVNTVANAIADYILDTPGVPKDWDQLPKIKPPKRLGLSFINSSDVVNPLKVIHLMLCNNTLNPYYLNPLSDVTLFTRMTTGSSNYGVRIELRNFFNVKVYRVNNEVYVNISKYLVGAKAYVLGVLKCSSSPLYYYLNMTSVTVLLNSSSTLVFTYPLKCDLISVTAIVSKGGYASISYLVDNSSIRLLPVTALSNDLTLLDLSPTPLPIGNPNYLVNASIFYYIPNNTNPTVISVSNLSVKNYTRIKLVSYYNIGLYDIIDLSNNTIKYSPSMHTIVIEVCERVGKKLNATAVYVVPLYPYLRLLCNGEYGLPSPTSAVPTATINRVVKVGLFDYVFNIKVWVMRS